MTLVWSLVMSSALFHDEMPALVDHTVEDLEKTFKRCFNKRYCIIYCNVNDVHVCSKFPPDVLHDENVMELLTLCAKRIEHMQVNSIGIVSIV